MRWLADPPPRLRRKNGGVVAPARFIVCGSMVAMPSRIRIDYQRQTLYRSRRDWGLFGLGLRDYGKERSRSPSCSITFVPSFCFCLPAHAAERGPWCLCSPGWGARGTDYCVTLVSFTFSWISRERRGSYLAMSFSFIFVNLPPPSFCSSPNLEPPILILLLILTCFVSSE